MRHDERLPPLLVKVLKAKEAPPHTKEPPSQEESCPDRPTHHPEHWPGTWLRRDFVIGISQIRKHGPALSAPPPPFLSFFYLFIHFNLYHPAREQILEQLLRPRQNTEQLGNQMGLRKTVAFGRAGSPLLPSAPFHWSGEETLVSGIREQQQSSLFPPLRSPFEHLPLWLTPKEIRLVSKGPDCS